MIAPTLAYDFSIKNDDLVINATTGDFNFGPSASQHVKDILASFPGWYKEFPLVGAGIPILLKAKVNPQKVEAIIKSQLETDGYRVARPDVTITANGVFKITPNAVRLKP